MEDKVLREVFEELLALSNEELLKVIEETKTIGIGEALVSLGILDFLGEEESL